MILGAQKCATTTVFDVLSRHPELSGARNKEPHFFSTTSDWRAGVEEYERLFDPDPAVRLRFEASTSYTFYPHRNLEIWRDLHDYNPDLKFIYLVRHPVARIRSSHQHSTARGYTREPLEQRILSNRLMLDVTRYHTQITPFIEQFGRDRVLLLLFEDFVQAPGNVLNTIAEFLEIDAAGFRQREPVHSNQSLGRLRRHPWAHQPPLVLRPVSKLMPRAWDAATARLASYIEETPEVSPEVQRLILRMLELEICGVERLMERDLSAWRVPI